MPSCLSRVLGRHCRSKDPKRVVKYERCAWFGFWHYMVRLLSVECLVARLLWVGKGTIDNHIE